MIVPWRQVPREPPPSGIAARLLALADAARRLPPPDHRQPERFHEAKSDLCAQLRDLAMQVSRTLKGMNNDR